MTTMSTGGTTAAKRRQRREPFRIAEQLNMVQVAIDNALADAELQHALAAYGYTAARLEQGRRLYQSVRDLHLRQQSGYGGQRTASDAASAAWKQANDVYTRLSKVARIALKEQPGDCVALGLNGARKQGFAGWLAQAQQFYTNALAQEAVLAKLGEFGITATKLKAGQVLVVAAEAANTAQKRDKGAAQQATQARNMALRQLTRWHRDFMKIARIALEDEPQRLEQLGIVAPSPSVELG